MTEKEALNEVQHEVNRLSLTSAYRGYCSQCGSDGKMILHSDVRNMTTECYDCYAKRRMKELTPQITESDPTEVKEQRAQTVRDYFAKRRPHSQCEL